MNVTGGISRQTHLLLTIVMSFVVVVGACTGTSSSANSTIPWSADPCGLAPPQDVAAAFGEAPTAVGGAPAGECRYRVDDLLLRLVVLSDRDSCDAATRTYAALGSELIAPADAPPGVFVISPDGDIVVCDAAVTYVVTAGGRTDELLDLARVAPSQRSD